MILARPALIPAQRPSNGSEMREIPRCLLIPARLTSKATPKKQVNQGVQLSSALAKSAPLAGLDVNGTLRLVKRSLRPQSDALNGKFLYRCGCKYFGPSHGTESMAGLALEQGRKRVRPEFSTLETGGAPDLTVIVASL